MEQKLLRTVIIPNTTPAADGTYDWDLPVQPMSHLDLTIKALNVTNEATRAEILAMVSKIEVLWHGQSVMSISATDLDALNSVLFGGLAALTNQVATDNATRSITLRVPFGRVLYDPAECMPETRLGDLKLFMTVDIANGGADGLLLICEAVCLPGAQPASYLKVTTASKTPSSGIDNDTFLPCGNLLAGLLIYSTTVPTGTAWTASVSKIRLLLDNVAHTIINQYWETLHAVLLRRVEYPGNQVVADGDEVFVNYGLVDLAPYGANDYLIDTADVSLCNLSVLAGDANIYRVMPLEIVRL